MGLFQTEHFFTFPSQKKSVAEQADAQIVIAGS